MVKKYIPDCGDIVVMNFTPQAGHEQAGRRPALVISPRAYNDATGLCVALPITSVEKDYPFEVPLPKQCTTFGVVLADHVRTVDYRARQAEFKEQAPNEVLKRSKKLLQLLVG